MNRIQVTNKTSMKLTFVGLSCFLIEDKKGGRLLIDPFNDTPRWTLGLTLPKKLNADIFLASHADADHSYLDERFVEHKQRNDEKHTTNISIFPDLNLRGTLVKEWNGDLCIAYHFTVDGLRCLHLADNSHPLTKKQIKEFGQIDILFLPMTKSRSENIDVELKIIGQLKPKIVIPSHTIPLPLKTVRRGYKVVYEKIKKIMLPHKNPAINEYSFGIFSYMLLVANNLTKKISTKEITGCNVEIKKLPSKTTVYYFDKCSAK
ncbi:MAG: Zn-dependent hydrolases of the metallo-beta-lactamase superfamily [Parcubacteria group bacterium GW2011_GWA2_40_23]|nr:MAG: Zn-dependent hydrolases of the metallo-beta-lactamase superfamily [Parcubacteria group bacterium GW2011_GWA2_40_23]